MAAEEMAAEELGEEEAEPQPLLAYPLFLGKRPASLSSPSFSCHDLQPHPPTQFPAILYGDPGKTKNTNNSVRLNSGKLT